MIDARGMRCPWPALRTARAMREAAPGAPIEIVADDPLAEAEITALARAAGWEISVARHENASQFTLLKG